MLPLPGLPPAKIPLMEFEPPPAAPLAVVKLPKLTEFPFVEIVMNSILFVDGVPPPKMQRVDEAKVAWSLIGFARSPKSNELPVDAIVIASIVFVFAFPEYILLVLIL